MTSIALINDVHFGTRDDSEVFHNHIERFFTKEFFPSLIKQNIKTVVCLGDLFDKRKSINFYTLDRTKRYFFDRLKEYDMKLIVLVGNHDVLYKSSNEINSPEQLLNDYDNIVIHKDPTSVEIEGKMIDVIPWINKNNHQATIDLIEKSSSMICFAHLELEGFIFQQGVVAQSGMSLNPFVKYHSVLTGHYHSKSSKGNIHYLGSQYDLTWADYGEKKYWHTFDVNTFELTAIENPHRMFIKLYYSDVDDNFEEELKEADFSDLTNCVVQIIIKERNNPILFDLFMDKVNKTNPFDVIIIDNEEYSLSEESDVDLLVSDTHTILKSSIDKLEANVDKNELLMLMNNLYSEASISC